jgi:serine O-acetyltransferase
MTVPRRIVDSFDVHRSRPNGLRGLIISDYLAYYVPTPTRQRWGVSGSLKQESPSRLALLFVPRVIHNPCLHAVILIRLATHSPRFTLGLWRTLLISKHSIDIHGNIEIGPGLMFPHPHGMTFGWGLRIGRDVTILQNVTIGGLVQRPETRLSPRIGDDVVIYGHSLVLGPIEIGDGAVVGAGSWLDHDLAPGEVHRGRPRSPAPVG